MIDDATMGSDSSSISEERGERWLVDRVAAGDPEALAMIYDEHAEDVYREVEGILGDPALAAEVSAEVFLHFWERPDPFDVASGALGAMLRSTSRTLSAEKLAAVGGAAGNGDGHDAPSGTGTPPEGLRGTVLSEATVRRVPGLPMVGAVGASPAEAYGHQRERLDLLLDEVAPEDWAERAEPYPWNVHELLGHLLAIEEYTGSILGLWSYDPPEGTEHHHLRMTEPTIASERGLDPGHTVATWRQRSAAIAADVASRSAESLDEQVSFHFLTQSMSSLVTLRAFELWTHADDIRRAVGRPLEAPPAAELRSMSDLAVNALPLALGFHSPEHAQRPFKIVLTGAGGGTWHLNNDGSPDADAEPELTVVADVIDFCRYMARRVDPADLTTEIMGDRELADALLDAARLLAV